MSVPDSVPTPLYEMRRRLAVRVLRKHKPGRFLEAGCGWGELLPTLVRLGYTGVAIEPSDESRLIALDRTIPMRDRVDVVRSIDEVGTSGFDYVLAFEVLEHLEHDTDELGKWVSMLRRGGTSVVSVPAHEEHWTESDIAVGHVRRYSADSLRRLHEKVGLSIVDFWSYGFPFTAVTRRLRDVVNSRREVPDDVRERTLDSASVSHLVIGVEGTLFSGLARGAGAVADLLQRPFLRTQWGDGFFVIARKE